MKIDIYKKHKAITDKKEKDKFEKAERKAF